MDEQRNLTDADVEAIVNRVYDKITQDFYSHLGKGLWALVQKAFIVVVVGIAAWGALRK